MKRVGLFILATIVAGVLASIPVRSGGAGPQESKLKNIKVLTGMSDAEITKEMQVWVKALGVKCTHCHKLGDFASDENEKKEIARKMATMVKTINMDFLTGDNKATCMHCHRGAAIPTLEGAGN